MKFSPVAALLLTASSQLGYAQQIYASNSVPVLQDDENIAANFPEPELELYSPAFINLDGVLEEFANGTSGPTSQATMEAFLQELADRNEWMTYTVPDFSSEEGRSIPYIYLSSDANATFDGSKALESGDKIRIYLHGGVHGNEPAGDEAVMAFLGALDNNQTYAEAVLSAAEFLVVPRYNPDGVAYFQRFMATGFDPNRDHVKLRSQQTFDIKALNVAFNAHISIDCHEYNAPRAFGPDEDLTTSQDGQFSAFKNMNIHPRIRSLAEGLFAENIASAMDVAGLRHSPYVVAASTPEINFTEFITDNNGDDQVALSQGIAYLSETRGIRLADQHFKRRVAAGLTIIRGVVDTAVANAAEVYELIESTRDEYAQSDEDIILLSAPRPTNITWPLISLENGSMIDVPIAFGNNTPALAVLTRPRPEAYIFSAAWPDVAARLRAVGVEVQQLDSPWVGEVEALNITNATVARTKFEGAAQTTIWETETILKNVSFPGEGGEGAYWVDSRQQRAAHAFVRLEPETESGFAKWNVLPVATGDEWPIYRVPRSRD